MLLLILNISNLGVCRMRKMTYGASATILVRGAPKWAWLLDN